MIRLPKSFVVANHESTGLWSLSNVQNMQSTVMCATCVVSESTSFLHYSDVIIMAMASPVTGVLIIYPNVSSGVDQRKHKSSASLAFVRGIHRWLGISLTKGQWREICFHLMTSSWHHVLKDAKNTFVVSCNNLLWIVSVFSDHSGMQITFLPICMVHW